MLCGGIIKDNMSKSKIDPCEVCSLRVKASSVFCLQCCKWIHGRRDGNKLVAPKLQANFTCRICEWDIEKAVEHEA